MIFSWTADLTHRTYPATAFGAHQTHTDTSEALQKAPLFLLTACQGGTTLQIMATASLQPYPGVYCTFDPYSIAYIVFTWCPKHCSDL